MRYVLLMMTIFYSCYAMETGDMKTYREAKIWAEKEFQKEIPAIDMKGLTEIKESASYKEGVVWAKEQLKQTKEKLLKNLTGEQEKVSRLLIFVSLSLPENTLLQLFKEAEKYGGELVLRGLPGNSFSTFVTKIRAWNVKGYNVEFDINPDLFKEYKIEKVPCFVFLENEVFDKACGNISLEYFLEKCAEEGDTMSANKILGEKL